MIDLIPTTIPYLHVVGLAHAPVFSGAEVALMRADPAFGKAFRAPGPGPRKWIWGGLALLAFVLAGRRIRGRAARA